MAGTLTHTSQGGPVATSLIPPYCITSPSPTGPLADTVSCIISESSGFISVLDLKFQLIKRWRGWNTYPGSSGANPHEDEGVKGKGKAKAKERGAILLECGGVLLGIGEDDAPAQFPILKIWDLMHDDNKTKGPVLMRNVRLGTGSRGYPVGQFWHLPHAHLTYLARAAKVTTISSTANLSYLAIGLVSGQVLLYRHVSESLTTSPQAITSFPKARVVWEGSLAEPITGLGFRDPLSPLYQESEEDGSGDSGAASKGKLKDKEAKVVTSLFITTTSKTIVIPSVTGRGTDPRILEESEGAGLGCVVMDGTAKDLIVGREEGIYLYGIEGKGAVLAYEGPKASIHTHGHSLVIVSPPFSPSASSNSATVRRAASVPEPGSSSSVVQSAKVSVFDLSNKFVSYSAVHKHGVQHIITSASPSPNNNSSATILAVHLLLGDGSLIRLSEISTQEKIEALYRKNLYTLAGAVARNEGMDEQEIKEIWSRYGDYLYTKGDFEGSIGQFVKTIGYLQPSYVIRKFLDAQRIQNLITYLQELHARGLATPDHTTLLLNCYTKTSDAVRLDAFLKTEMSRPGELPFDLETAIRVCRQAGFYDHATYLAKRYRKDQEYIEIMLEDVKDYQAALDYLSLLEPKIAERNLLRYGRTLLRNRPKETTDVLIDLCSGKFLNKQKSIASDAAQRKRDQRTNENQVQSASGPNYLSYLGYEKVTGVFSSTLAAANTSDKTSTVDIVPTTDAAVGTPEDQPILNAEEESSTYSIPSPRQFFAHFISSPSHFVRFLESVATDRWHQTIANTSPDIAGAASRIVMEPIDQGSPINNLNADEADQRCIWNTLLELYLTDAQDQQSESTSVSRNKALNVLDQMGTLPVDPMHALMVCSTADFTPGQIRIWEKLGMYEEVLRFWMNLKEDESANVSTEQRRSPTENVLHYLHLYGPTNPGLYPHVLRHLSSDSKLTSQYAGDVRDILKIIDEENLMPPLAVVQLLSRNSVTSIGVVKNWLKAKVADTRHDVESDQTLMKSYRNETEEKLKEIANLADTGHPQVFQVTRCAACGGQLDLPTVHFMCKHSYHQRCLPDADPECPSCARQYAVIREVRRHQQELADHHDTFLAEVAQAKDGFAVVAGAFGRGLLNKPIQS
ncbi:hypothetical protein QFC21_003105 [Naganishia friedmannii]|uniref:Uncharacterized protein n=1 Tax=Naganishia friedmannii TaxID=89922 RepID=A0ACC2VRM2_9TREE|nr:hypothetical protein QFC21_003105 [Naganishia friedmannii]